MLRWTNAWVATKVLVKNDYELHRIVSGLNAKDKSPMYEMPQTFVIRSWFYFCSGISGAGVSSLAFCPQMLIKNEDVKNLSFWHVEE